MTKGINMALSFKKKKRLMIVLVFAVLACSLIGALANKKYSLVQQVKGEVDEQLSIQENGAARYLAKLIASDAILAYFSHQLSDALQKNELALLLDPSNSAARARLISIKNELKSRIDESYARGVANYQSMHYSMAIQDWESCLTLIANRSDEQYKKIEGYIALTAAKKEGDI